MMKLIFTKFHDFFGRVLLLLLITYSPSSIFLSGCTQKSAAPLELAVQNYQAHIDSVLTNSIELQTQQVSTEINHYSNQRKDTFELAKQKIILKSVAFKIASRYTLLDSALINYKSKKINEHDLETTLMNAKNDVDSLLTNTPVFN